MAVHKHKRHDTFPPLRATLFDATGTPPDLTGSTVRFFMRELRGTNLLVSGSMTGWEGNALTTDGKVEYAWAVGDTAKAGEFLAEYEVTRPDGKKQTFPTIGQDRVRIYGDLDDA